MRHPQVLRTCGCHPFFSLKVGKRIMSRPAVFLDRDGTLIEHFEFLTDPNDVQVMPSVAPALKLLRDRGFVLVMITNQSAVARGMITEKKLHDIHNRLKLLLTEQGVYLDKVYYCPFHPDGAVEKYRRDSELRKPSPGMIHLAARELDIDLAGSWVVGDDDRDILCGQAANCRTILIESYGSVGVRRGQSSPDFKAVNLQEAANIIVRHAQKPQPQPEFVADDPKIVETQEPQAVIQNHHNNKSEAVEIEPVINEPEPGVEEAEVEEVVAKAAIPKPLPQNLADDRDANEMLRLILREMQTANREKSFTEFSVAKLLAGVFQMIAVFCMVMAFYFGNGLEPDPQAVTNSLLWAAVFQLLTLTWFMVHRH